MSNLMHTHAMLLSLQLASVFKYVDDVGIHRETYNNFHSIEGEHGDIITVAHRETTRKGKSQVDAIVNSERNGFRFRQLYNYGILLEIEISYLTSSGEYKSLLEAIHNKLEEDTYIAELMIDFEYSIAIFTEYVASNVNRM